MVIQHPINGKVSKITYLGCKKHDKTQFTFLKRNLCYEAQRQREKKRSYTNKIS
jgi:hypothetical protein